MLIRLLNTHVPDHILVKGHVTKRSTEYSKNLFCDPTDSEETAYYDDELTPIEKGHYYLWKEEKQTSSIIVHMPYRIMDRETGDLLKGCSSFRSIGRMISRSVPQRLTLSPVSCLQDFILSKSDFLTFSNRVSILGGTVVKDEVNVEKLIEDIGKITLTSYEVLNKIQSLRETYCLASDSVFSSEEDFHNVLKEFVWAREEATEVSNKRASVIKRLQALSTESGRNTDYIRASSEQEKAQAAVALLNSTNFDRITREAIHKYQVDCGVETATGVPAHIGSLAVALAELRKWYPSLAKVSGHGDCVVVELSGLRIVLTPASIKVDGDPAILKPYIDGGATIDTSGNASLRRRRRNIVPEVKE